MKQNNNILDRESKLKANPFATPSGYFDKLPHQIHGRKIAEAEDAPKSIFRLLLPQVSIAVGFVALFLFCKLLFSLAGAEGDIKSELANKQQNTTTNSNMAKEAKLTAEDEYIITYLVDQEISDEDIALLASDR